MHCQKREPHSFYFVREDPNFKNLLFFYHTWWFNFPGIYPVSGFFRIFFPTFKFCWFWPEWHDDFDFGKSIRFPDCSEFSSKFLDFSVLNYVSHLFKFQCFELYLLIKNYMMIFSGFFWILPGFIYLWFSVFLTFINLLLKFTLLTK